MLTLALRVRTRAKPDAIEAYYRAARSAVSDGNHRAWPVVVTSFACTQRGNTKLISLTIETEAPEDRIEVLYLASTFIPNGPRRAPITVLSCLVTEIETPK